MDHEQKEQCNFFEVALFFLFLQISRECATMEARRILTGYEGTSAAMTKAKCARNDAEMGPHGLQ